MELEFMNAVRSRDRWKRPLPNLFYDSRKVLEAIRMRDIRPLIGKPLAFLVRDFKIAASYRLQFLLQGFGILLTTFTFSLVARMFDGQSLPALAPYGGDFFAFAVSYTHLTLP